MKKQVTIGYIYGGKNLWDEDKIFKKVAKKKNIDLLFFNVDDELNESVLEKQARKCDIIFNNTAGYLAIELIKTFEELGIKVIEGSNSFYYTEDKWMFYLKCREHKIPTPETILLPQNFNGIVKELKEFSHWPVILKRVYGEQGDYVQKADDIEEAKAIVKRFWGEEDERIPIIAQEFVRSEAYRITMLGGEMIQAILKERHGWKSTAVYAEAESIKPFSPDKELIALSKKITKMADISICGIDFLKKDSKWLVIEINAEPSFEFFENDMERVIGKVLDYLTAQSKK